MYSIDWHMMQRSHNRYQQVPEEAEDKEEEDHIEDQEEEEQAEDSRKIKENPHSEEEAFEYNDSKLTYNCPSSH